MGSEDSRGDPAFNVDLSWPAAQPGEPPIVHKGAPPVAERSGEDPGGLSDDARPHEQPGHGVDVALAELREEVRGLREVFLESSVHAELVAAVVELRRAVERAPGAAGMAPVLEELATVRREVTALRRRIHLRADADW